MYVLLLFIFFFFFFFQAEDGIRDWSVTGVQTCALPILSLVRYLPRPRHSTNRSSRTRLLPARSSWASRACGGRSIGAVARHSSKRTALSSRLLETSLGAVTSSSSETALHRRN